MTGDHPQPTVGTLQSEYVIVICHVAPYLYNIHSFLLVRNGYLVLDAYFYPYDKSLRFTSAKDASVRLTFTDHHTEDIPSGLMGGSRNLLVEDSICLWA